MPYKDKEKQKEYDRQRKRNFYLSHKQNGLCVKCFRKVAPASVYCFNHIHLYHHWYKRYRERNRLILNLKAKEYHKRLKAQGRCTNCGVYLWEGEGAWCCDCLHMRAYGSIKGVLYEITNKTT